MKTLYSFNSSLATLKATMIGNHVKYIKYAMANSFLEHGLCILLAGLFISHLIRIEPKDPKVLQYNSFEEFTSGLIDCSSIYNHESTSSSVSKDPLCPIDEERLARFSLDNMKPILNFGHVEKGGRFKPKGCRPLQKTAIIIPYRNREDQLEKFTTYMHQFLPNQLIDYTIFVIEQSDMKRFNRAKLFNVGYLEALKLHSDICCFIFHDVDLLPVDQKNLYMCSHMPRHMSSEVNTYRYKLLYQQLFGGVVAISKTQYKDIGGNSNSFYGWGAEDDFMFQRIMNHGMIICRAPPWISMYDMMKHSKEKPNPLRYEIMWHVTENDNLSSTDYKLVNISYEPLYTLISVKL